MAASTGRNPDCFWTGQKQDSAFGPELFDSVSGTCEPYCYTQDPTLKACTNPINANILCILAGVLNLLMGLFGLGFIVDFISYPVLSGFVSAASVTIASGQLKHIFGVTNRRKPYLEVIYQWYDTVDHLGSAHWPDMLMSVLCIAITIGLQKLKGKMDAIAEDKPAKRKRTTGENVLWLIGTAGNFMTILFGTILAYIWEAASPDEVCGYKYLHNSTTHTVADNCLSLTGTITHGIPKPEMPPIHGSDISNLAVPAVLVALLGFLESIAIANAFARANGYDNDLLPSQELVAIGLGNIVSGFFHSYPITGSFSRTAVNSASGVATPASGIVTGIIVLVALQFITQVMEKIPKAALSAIIIVSVIKMFNWKIVQKMWKVSKIDLIPWTLSFSLCLLLDIKFGILIGAGANILILLYNAARPYHPVLVKDVHTKTWRALGPTEAAPNGQRGVTVMRVGTSIFYPAGNAWKIAVRQQIQKDKATAIVLDCCAISAIDFSGVQAFIECTEDCSTAGAAVVVTALSSQVYNMLDRAGVWDKVEYQALLPDAVAAAEARAAENGVAGGTMKSLAGSINTADETAPLLTRANPMKSPIN